MPRVRDTHRTPAAYSAQPPSRRKPGTWKPYPLSPLLTVRPSVLTCSRQPMRRPRSEPRAEEHSSSRPGRRATRPLSPPHRPRTLVSGASWRQISPMKPLGWPAAPSSCKCTTQEPGESAPSTVVGLVRIYIGDMMGTTDNPVPSASAHYWLAVTTGSKSNEELLASPSRGLCCPSSLDSQGAWLLALPAALNGALMRTVLFHCCTKIVKCPRKVHIAEKC